MIRRQITHRARNRRVIQETAPARPGDITPVFTLDTPTTDFLITTDFPFVLQKQPPNTGSFSLVVTADAVPVLTVSFTQESPTSLRVHCAGVLNDPVFVHFPEQWPYVRTNMGGYITPGTYTFAGVP